MEARMGDVFVGRARELGELEAALETVEAGVGATVLVAGDAGIGKTRLASELSTRAREAGFDVLVGRSIDLVGTELPYQPFVEALRPLGDPRQLDASARGSQLRVFETTLALLADRAASSPTLLVLEDLHWADLSTLDLVVYLAHNVDDRPVLLIATYRADDAASTVRMRRLAVGVRRSGSALVLELGPLEREELAELLEARADHPLSEALTDAIAARSEGNPFLAEELLAAAGEQSVELPPGLRDLLLQRVARLDEQTQDVLRLASAAGRNVGYSLLRATVKLTDSDLRDSLRAAVEGGILLAEPETSSFRFRHALLAEAIYVTILPGEREELHARLAEELVRSGAAGAAELASHWAAAGRAAEALAASVEAARQTEAVFGLAEALAHLERALALWDAVPDANELTGLRLAELCSWVAELASRRGAAQRAVELGRRAIELVGADDPHRAALLHVRLGEYLHETGENEAGLAALERAVELAPAEPPSPEGAYALASLAGGLMVAWRYTESLPVSEHALALAREVGAGEAEVRALTVLGGDLAYLGRSEEGLAYFRRALQLAEEIGDHFGLERAYGNLTDALMMLGRPADSARVGEQGLEVVRRYGIHSSLLVANGIEALLAIGEWDAADRKSGAAVRALTADSPHVLLMLRADCELGRGDFEAARTHLEDALVTLREDHWQGIYDVYLAELALWERRWADADQAVSDSLATAHSRETSQLRVWFCAKGLRAQAELAAIARARRDSDALRFRLGRARDLLSAARSAAAEASGITPNADAWSMVAEAEYKRARGLTEPQSWADAAATWDQLERPPLAAYCRWREAEALVAAGASRAAAGAPLRDAYAVAERLRARPLLHELELLAQRARLDLNAPETGPREQESLEESLGLTPREAEVLSLVARGYTNREIADTLVISIRTAGVHVSHILRKLEAPNRREAAAIAHRFAAPVVHRRDG
jgi:DNA-binding CsgD family transcriptional regulator/tetratricopeptide (TPR) repeat protein